MNRITRGGKGGGATRSARAGLIVASKFSHGYNPRPNSGGAVRDDGGIASMASMGGPRGLGPVGQLGWGGEYGWI